MTNPDIRAAFEKRFGPNDSFAWRDENDNYKSASLQSAWEVWQACAASLSNSIAVGELPPVPRAFQGQFEYVVPDESMTRIENGYTTDQMRAYGQSCAEAAAHKVWCAEVNCDAVREELAELKAARQPAPVVATQEQILKARQEGRMEAMAIILHQDAESPFDDQVTSSANADAGDYSTYWNEAALRELLHIDDTAYNAFDKAEEQYWDYRGYAIECKIAEEQRRAALAATAAPVLSDEQIWDLLVDEVGVEHISGTGEYAKSAAVLWTPAQAAEVFRAILAATRSQP